MPLTNAQKQQRARDKRKRVAAQTAQTLERYRGALERLASMEAFTHSRAVRAGQDDELIARISYAEAALTPTSHEMEGK